MKSNFPDKPKQIIDKKSEPKKNKPFQQLDQSKDQNNLQSNQQQIRQQELKLEYQYQLLEDELQNLTLLLDSQRIKNQEAQEFKDQEIEDCKNQVYEIQNQLEMQERDSQNEINKLQNTLNQLVIESQKKQLQLQESNQKKIEENDAPRSFDRNKMNQLSLILKKFDDKKIIIFKYFNRIN